MRRPSVILVFAVTLIAVSLLVRHELKDVTRTADNGTVRLGRKDGPHPAAEISDPATTPLAEKAVTPFLAGQTEPGKKLSAIQPRLIESSAMQRILAGSDPEARTMFQRGLESLNQGDFSNARTIFQEILGEYGCDCRQNRLAAPAYWSIGLSYYQEGGEAGLSSAGTFFQSFLKTYSNCDAKELDHAAQINIAIIYMERMRLAAKDPARERAAQSAAEALKAFLEKWPDSPQAYAASVYLRDLESYVGKQR